MKARETDLGTLLTISINSFFLVLTCIFAPCQEVQAIWYSIYEKSISEEIWYIFGGKEYIQRLDNNIFIYNTSKVDIIVLWPRETSSENIPEFPGEADPEGEILSSILEVSNTFS